jgi:glycerol-3-phosphate acyltransferase PlsX
MIRIVLDAMGGDNAPYVTVEGAYDAVEEVEDLEVLLVGPEDIIKPLIKKYAKDHERVLLYHASQWVEMDEEATTPIRRKKDSSIRRGIEMVKQGNAHAFVSAGHSGAVMATALLLLGKIEGVKRPAIAVTMPTLKDKMVLLDAGANLEVSPENLLQFAIMGSVYCRDILGIDNPRVGLLSIGEEATKGTDEIKEAFKLLKQTDLNFIGMVEGKDIYRGEVEVVVCDGFIGNVVLKVSEGLAETILKMLKMEIASITTGRIAYLLMKPALKNYKKKTDYAEYGGAPLLGIKGTCLITHGRASSKAIKNAIKQAYLFARTDFSTKLIGSLERETAMVKEILQTPVGGRG